MSRPSCDACTELRERAPEFVMNGVTDNVANSLRHNSGVAWNGDNCEDLQNVNDCLIGRKVQEIESFDVCDWKEFMSGLGGNLYEMLKAMLMNDCGQWDLLRTLCLELQMMLYPETLLVGVHPQYEPAKWRHIGEVGTKGGNPLIAFQNVEEIPPNYRPFQGVGIYYRKETVVDCDGSCKIFEWVAPHAYRVSTTADLEIGDIIWYADKQTLQREFGVTDAFWDTYSYYAAGDNWDDWYLFRDNRHMHIRMVIDENRMGLDYLTLVYEGTDYPSAQQPGSHGISFARTDLRLHKSGC